MRHTSLTLTSLILAPFFAISFCSCTDEPFGAVDSSTAISFNVSVASNGSRAGVSQERRVESACVLTDPDGDSLFLHPIVSDFASDFATASRSSMVNSAEALYNEFYVSAYSYNDTWDSSHLADAPNYFEMEVARSSGSVYEMSPRRYWPESGKIRFVAHAPVGDGAYTFYPVDDAGRGPRVHIDIAESVKDQNDLLVAFSEENECSGGSHGAAPLNFKHALTGVRFLCDKNMPKGIITNITLKGVRHEGDYFYNITSSTQSSSADVTLDDSFNGWDIYDKTFSLDLNHAIARAENDIVNDGELTFMMFPQTLPDSAKVEITVQHVDDAGNPIQEFDHISGSLSGRLWPAGKIVTYKISTSDQILEVSEPQTFNYLGKVYDPASDSFATYGAVTVSSYAGDSNMRWKVEYMDDDATAWNQTSSWLSVDPTWTWQDKAEQEVRFVAKSSFNSIDIDANLKKATAKGSSASPYNLANASGASTVENTANSYIVSAPGYYILPLVYGNAIKDSQTNAQAYVYSGAAASDILSAFQNHLGAAISAPYIADNSGCVPDHASIVWQDAQNLVSNVEYVAGAFGGKGGIRFYVNPSNIMQGNAVVAISDKNNIMWSWHIWVTSFDGFDSTVDLKNQDGLSFTLMPVNLGWCSNGAAIRYYPQRKCKARFTPVNGDTGLSREVTFVEESHTSIPFGNNPYYQWGRKDPFVGTNMAWGNKERWDGAGTYYGPWSQYNPPRLFSDLVEDTNSDRLTTRQCLDLLIKNPDKWHNPPAVAGGTSYVSKNETYVNLWGDNTLTDTKTVYDPCPAGYQVNYFYTYTGFLASGYDWSSDAGINFVKETAPDWDSTNLAEFYTDSSKLHSITFPVCGYRDWNDKAGVVDFTVRGFVWLRGCSDDVQSYMFRYGAHTAGLANVAPVTMFYSTDGLPIRPALSR